MAFLEPTAVWSDVRQIETNDPVIGGPPNVGTGAGFSNIPNLQLAQRDEWLRDRVGGFTQTIVYAASAALSPDAVGSRGVWTGAGAGILTLPLLANVPEGSSYYLTASSAALTVALSGADQLSLQNGTFLPSVTLAIGDDVRITRGLGAWVITGGSLAALAAPTPPRFANDRRAANTEFVQRALGNYSSSIPGVAGSTLTAADVGRVVICNQAPGVVTLPLANSVPSGAQVTLFITGPGWTVARQGGDMINTGLLALTSRALGQGDHLTLVSDGGTVWNIVGGAGQLAGSTAFGASLAASGWQRLPSGLIMQWGAAANAGSGARQIDVTLPVAFPTAHLRSLAVDTGAGCFPIGATPLSTTQIRLFLPSHYLAPPSGTVTPTGAITANWLAIGH